MRNYPSTQIDLKPKFPNYNNIQIPYDWSSAQKYYIVLGITEQQGEKFQIVKKAYRKLMVKNSMKRSERIRLNVAYCTGMQKILHTKTPDILKAIAMGDQYKLQKILQKDSQKLNQLVLKYPPIYHAVRSGHYDIVKFFLQKGCSLYFEDHKSTPMHCASYYGHYQIIPLLLQYGIPTQIKNIYKHRPIQEAATEQIRNLLKDNQTDKINALNQSLLKNKLAYTLINIKKQNEVWIKKIVLKRYFIENFNQYSDAFHGTKFDNLQSIAKNGLRRPGDVVDGRTISTVSGHIQLGRHIGGIQNWAQAIFVSPSIYYAAHPLYSKQVINKNVAWLPIVQVKVLTDNLTKHDHTELKYHKKDNQPTQMQWKVQSKIKKSIYRCSQPDKVHVVAIIFIKKGFLDKHQDFEEATKLILNSGQQRKFREKLSNS